MPPSARLLLLCTALLALAGAAHAKLSFPVHRVMQLDEAGAPLGSRRALVSLKAAAAPALQGLKAAAEAAEAAGGKPRRRGAGDLKGRMAVVRLAEASEALLEEVVDFRGASGVLLLLPAAGDAASAEAAAAQAGLEHYLVSREFDVPVYVAVEDEAVAAVFDEAAGAAGAVAGEDAFQLEVGGAEAEPLKTVRVHALHGWLHASAAAGGDAAPTVLVAANFDSFSAAPSLPGGANHNGSGAVALLELLRVFARLYGEFRTHGGKNLLFVLTGAGTLDFAATGSWVQGLDRRVLDSVELVVCLDSLGAGDAVHMHYSKKPKTPEIRALYGSIEEAAEGAGVRLEKHQHKINIADPATRWQHEQFVRGARHLVAVTLSGRAAAHEGGQFGGGPGMTDRAVDADVLRRNVRFVAEALGRVVYGGGVEVASGAHGVSDEFLGAYTRFMASQPRSAVHFEKTSPVLAELERVLRRHATDVARRAYPLDTEDRVYYASAGAAEMEVYKVKPFFFHVLQLVTTVGYLAFVHYALRFFAGVFDEAKQA